MSGVGVGVGVGDGVEVCAEPAGSPPSPPAVAGSDPVPAEHPTRAAAAAADKTGVLPGSSGRHDVGSVAVDGFPDHSFASPHVSTV